MKSLNDSYFRGKEVSPEEELKHFKNVVKSLMNDASRVLAEIELLSHGSEIEEKLSLLDHYLGYTTRLCENEEYNHIGDIKDCHRN